MINQNQSFEAVNFDQNDLNSFKNLIILSNDPSKSFLEQLRTLYHQAKEVINEESPLEKREELWYNVIGIF